MVTGVMGLGDEGIKGFELEQSRITVALSLGRYGDRVTSVDALGS